MGREVRRVPADWKHPKDSGNYRPLYDEYRETLAEFSQRVDEEGLDAAIAYHGRIKSEDYMPDWPDKEQTHFQMYETCTEGTPISPVMESPEALARWLADNGASAFGKQTATYEQWLATIGCGSVVSAVLTKKGLVSGVEFMGDKKP